MKAQNGNLQEQVHRRRFLAHAGGVAGSVIAALHVGAVAAEAVPTDGIITTVAGGGPTGVGGPATQATLSTPFSVSVDGADNVYLSDNYYHRVYMVERVTGILRALAGSGSPGYNGDNIPATSATLTYPYGIAADRNGNVVIADTNNQRVRYVQKSSGKIFTVAGTGEPGFNGDGIKAKTARLASPQGAAFDKARNIYIADSKNNRIRVVNLGAVPLVLYPQSTSPVTIEPGNIGTAAGTGAAGYSGNGGFAVAANLNIPWNVAFDTSGNLFISDYYNQRVRRVDKRTGTITLVAGNGTKGFSGDGGPATQARITYPCGLAFDSYGDLYIGQEQSNTVRKVTMSTGIISTVAGLGGPGSDGDGGPARNAKMNAPTGVAIDSLDNLFISEYGNTRTRIVDAVTQVITTYAGSSLVGNGGPATEATLSVPCGFCVDEKDQILLADQSNHLIRLVDTAGIISVVAGTGAAGYNGDGIPAPQAQVQKPADVQLDPSTGAMIICDRGNRRIRRVDPVSGLISTIAGTGVNAYGGDGGAATSAQLADPRAITLSPEGNLYIATLGDFRVRFVNLGSNPVTLYPGSPNALLVPAGVIVTIAGNGVSGSSGDGGPAVQAKVNSPRGVTLDPTGNLYVTEGGRDPQNLPGPNVVNDCMVRKVDGQTGVISTVAGTLTPGYNGDGIPATQAELSGPRNAVVDQNGNILIADSLNNRLRQIDSATGLISTIVGGTQFGFGGDGGPSSTATICTPRYITVDKSGNVYFTDVGNSRIRKIAYTSEAG